MRKSIAVFLGVAVMGLFLSGCASVLPVGAIYTEIKAPVSAGEPGKVSKVGEAKATSILGLVATGDCSIKAAMANGGITRIRYVDYYAKNTLGIYGEYTTTVYGE